jgi:MEDS: MEthanogen/methylotroph, DcmR Sensory domain
MLSSPSWPLPSSGVFGSDHRLFRHAVQFYLDEAFLLRTISELVLSAHKAGDRALIVATNAHHQALLQQIEKSHPDIRASQSNGTYIAVDADEVLTKCTTLGKLDLERLEQLCEDLLGNATAGIPRLFIFGELVALLCAQKKFEEALQLEKIWDVLLKKFPSSLLCGYPIQQFEKAGMEKLFVRICADHSTIIPPDAYISPESEKRILQSIADAANSADA